MDNTFKDLEGMEKKNHNTEYLATKCRVTKPPPPKPAANPLQFVKVAPCPLYQKAQEQIKKVEEIKTARKEVREEAEEWQQNLDNWKSSRRKRHEHIIERVVEVKKFEQEEQEKARRKPKTFNEMVEERSKGRHKFNIPLYNDDDSNDLSDYGIGSSSSKTNSIKDVDTDDNSSVLDEKDNNAFDCSSNKETSSASNQSQSEDETNIKATSTKHETSVEEKTNLIEPITTKSYTSNLYTNLHKTYTPIKIQSKTLLETKFNTTPSDTNTEKQQYTYEGAIQDYRTRIRTKINIDESVFNKSQDFSKSKEEVHTIVPKGNICKRKEIFEFEKPGQVNPNDTILRRLSEDFANTISIKERLQSLEKCTDQPVKTTDKSTTQIGSVKARLQSFNKQNDADTKNNNSKIKPLRSDVMNNNNSNKISNYLIEKSSSTPSFEQKLSHTNDWRNKEIFDRSSSPEADIYMNKLNMFNRDLDNLMFGKPLHNIDNGLDDYVRNSNYPPSTSSTELMTLSSDREDSGIHTADVSCSASRADEPFEDADLASTIPNCIEKLTIVKESELQEHLHDDLLVSKQPKDLLDNVSENENQSEVLEPVYTDMHNNNSLMRCYSPISLQDFLDEERKHSSENYMYQPDNKKLQESYNLGKKPVKEIDDKECVTKGNGIEENYVKWKNLPDNFSDNVLPKDDAPKKVYSMTQNSLFKENTLKNATSDKLLMNDEYIPPPQNLNGKQPAVYENVEIKASEISFPVEYITGDIFGNPLLPSKLEPPKVKPPPPPPQCVYENDNPEHSDFKRINSTKRIKKEIQIKRSSFLGLDEPTDDQLDPDIALDKPPDINSFLQKESQLEKSMYRKLQGSRDGGFSEVESQDSGLDVERGRLSSDTWCSSIVDSSTPVHDRQDSEQTNSFTSEEDEITKKEREIIELVEKEEKSRDSDYSSQATLSPINKPVSASNSYDNGLGSEKFDRPYFPPGSGYVDNLEDQDSKVLRVEHELLQLERGELERQRENMLFCENRAKLRQNRHSLENICDNVENYSHCIDGINYHNLMPELQHIPIEYRKSLPDVPSYKPAPEVEFHYRKSMPDIQHAYNRSVSDYRNSVIKCDVQPPIDYRKSMPELQEMQRTGFRSPPLVIRKPIMPGKPIRQLMKEQVDKERFMMLNPVESDALQHPSKPVRPLTKHNLHVLSAAPRSRHFPSDNWIQAKPNKEVKNYNQHWLFEEAELRRIADQKHTSSPSRSWQQQPHQEKHIPDSVIHTLTQRAQNRSINDRNLAVRSSVKPDGSPNSKEHIQHPYLGHPQTFGHALPMSYPPPVQEENQDKILSVSGKKKCSNCGNELGRGAAMIIESLRLFYHMDCFKCCVCHMQLGDGLMGTDVRVRNQKLHCHNCYSSEDGVKFSCV